MLHVKQTAACASANMRAAGLEASVAMQIACRQKGANPHETVQRRAKNKTPRRDGGPPIDFDELPTYIGYLVGARRPRSSGVRGDARRLRPDARLLRRADAGARQPGITQVALAAAFGVESRP